LLFSPGVAATAALPPSSPPPPPKSMSRLSSFAALLLAFFPLGLDNFFEDCCFGGDGVLSSGSPHPEPQSSDSFREDLDLNEQLIE
jgi:hypothetical protein